MITTGSNVGGTITMVLSFSGNDKYNAKDITITINTSRKVNLKSHVNGIDWGLAIKNGELKITGNNSGNDNQNWYMVAPVQANGTPVGGDAFWLYNASTHQYLTFTNDKTSPVAEFVTNKPIGTATSRFFFVSGTLNGTDYNGLLKESHNNHENFYMGVTSTTPDGNGDFPASMILKYSQGQNDGNIHSFTVVDL